MSYERKTIDAPVREDFWAFIDRPVPEDKPAGIGKFRSLVVRSPIFATQRELTAWIGSSFQGDDEVSSFRRELRDGSFRDVSLAARDDSLADPARLASLIAALRLQIEEARGELRGWARQAVRSAAERGKAARGRLVRAGQAVKETQ